MSQQCQVCGIKDAKFHCEFCPNETRYCGAQCQKDDWKVKHVFICGKRGRETDLVTVTLVDDDTQQRRSIQAPRDRVEKVRTFRELLRQTDGNEITFPTGISLEIFDEIFLYSH